jgi:predicted O-methyltransferase YrrM
VQLLAPSGVLLIDNMQGSQVILSDEGLENNESAVAVLELARELKSDDKLNAQLAPVRDGVMVITPKAPAKRSLEP